MILCFFCVGCSALPSAEDDAGQRALTDTITLASFGIPKKLTLEKMGLNAEELNVDDMAVVDTLLLLSSMEMPKILKIISIPSHKKLTEIVTRGKLKSECICISEILTTNNDKICWAFDVTTQKFVRIDLSKALLDSNYIPDNEFALMDSSKGAATPCWISDSLFAATSYSSGAFRYSYLDARGSVVKKIGSLPRLLKDLPRQNVGKRFDASAIVATAYLKKRPGSDEFVVAYKYSARMEFYKDGVLRKIVRGPDLSIPNLTMDYQADMVIPTENNKTMFSYFTTCATEKYVYALYSGSADFRACGQTILVFDWNGRPVKSLQLDSAVFCNFTVTAKGADEFVYAIDHNSGEILSAKIQ